MMTLNIKPDATGFLSTLYRQGFTNFQLSPFSILTGLNGSGKSQILSGINEAYITVEGIDKSQIALIRFDELMEQKTESRNIQQNCWSFLNTGHNQLTVPATGSVKLSFRVRIINIYREYLVAVQGEITRHLVLEEINDSTPIWAIEKKDVSSDLWERISNFKLAMAQEIFNDTEFKEFEFHTLIEDSYKKYGYVSSNGRFEYSKFVDVIVVKTLQEINSLFTNYNARRDQYANQMFNDDYEGKKSSWLREFEEKNPKPWEVLNELINEIRETFKDGQVFSFQIAYPGSEYYDSANNQATIYDPALGEPLDYDQLSSGEKVIFSLIVLAFGLKEGGVPPKLLLIDEIDATLHPSMIQAMLLIIKRVYLDQDSHVIFATHSPTTIALAEGDQFYVVQHGSAEEKITPVSRGEALDILTEGYVTLDHGTKLLAAISDKPICILSEGHNVSILKKYIETREIKDVEVIDAPFLISKTGADDLASYFQFLRGVPHKSKVLVIWDCDVKQKNRKSVRKLAESARTYGLILPHNTCNVLVDSGIENAFPSRMFEEFEKDEYGKIRLNTGEKKKFSDMVVDAEDHTIFNHLDCISDKLSKIRSDNQESTESSKPTPVMNA